VRHLFKNASHPDQRVFLPTLNKEIRFSNKYYETNDEAEMTELLWCIDKGYIDAEFTSAEERNASLKSNRMRKEASAKIEEARFTRMQKTVATA